MSIVIFLQNAWFPPGTPVRHLDSYQRDVSFRRQVLAQSMTGRRLLHAFGSAFWDIWWDNADPVPQIGDHRAMGVPDPIHMDRVLNEQVQLETGCRPRVIGLLGKMSLEGFMTMPSLVAASRFKVDLDHGNSVIEWRGLRVVRGAHPNAMGITNEDIRRFSDEVMEATTK